MDLKEAHATAMAAVGSAFIPGDGPSNDEIVSVYLTSLVDCGFVIVPKEATDDMINTAVRAYDDRFRDLERDVDCMKNAWDCAIDARPKLEG